MINIRKATLDDIDEIDKCNRLVLPENYDKKIYEQVFGYDGISSFVVTKEKTNKIIGYIISYVQQDNTKKTTIPSLEGHIMSIGILEDYRRKGYGKKLLECVENDLKKRFNIKYMTLHVRKTNKPAQYLYSKLYYNRHKKIKKYYDNNKDDFLMKKYIIYE